MAKRRRKAKRPGATPRRNLGKRKPEVARRSILITGFGAFPGARFNPTAPLVQKLARLRRPAFAEMRLASHVFPTSYAAVDRDLPKQIARHRPDAILMFGFAPRARHVRIETQARNAVAAAADAAGFAPRTHAIAAGKPSRMTTEAPFARLLAAARSQELPAALSRDAGRYLCNYLYWRAVEAAAKPPGPKLVAFIHVPPVQRSSARPGYWPRRAPDFAALLRAAEAILRVAGTALSNKDLRTPARR